MQNSLSGNFWRWLCAAVLVFLPVMAGAQLRTVRGNVSDPDGVPIIGAVVLVEGTNTASVTDSDGNYSISASDSQTLLFTCIGYVDVRESVGARQTINVTMREDATILEEAVAIGYATVRKRDLTGSVASVGGDAIVRSIPTSADQVLQGRAAGVQMTQNSGIPGGGTSIRIRGVNSLNSSNEPIIVIDGVVIDAQTGTNYANALSQINPNDIETMDVLKDASATAIYGAQGANGVILITTKRGRSGHTDINFDAQFGFQNMPRYLEVMNFSQYAEHYNTFAALRGATQRDEYANAAALGKGTDWQRELFKTAPMQQYNISLSGGNDKTTYAISAGYLNQDGIAYGSGFERETMRINVDTQAKDWLKLGASANVSHSYQNINSLAGNNEGLIQVALKQSPAVSVRSINGGYDGPEDANFAQSNPIGLANLLENYNKKAGVRSNFYGEISFLKDFKLRSEFSNDINFANYYNFTPTYKFGSIYNSENSRQQQKNYSLYWAWRNLLTWDKALGSVNLNLMLGQEMTSSHWEYILARRLNGPDNMHDISAGDQTTSTTNGSSGDSRFSSFFGRVFFSFKDRYLLTATLRADGSSNFAPGHRWGLFPSAAFAWRVSEEPWFPKDKVNELKFRLGYGAVGNSNVPAMAWQATLATVTTNWGNGYLTGRIPNEFLSWETTNSWNAGIDMEFLDKRVSVVLDAYYKLTDNLLMEAVLPAYVGTAGQGSTAAPYGNMGSISNKGFEFTVNTINVSRKDFGWTSSLVFSLNRNRVESLNTEGGVIDKTYQVSGTNTVVTRTKVGSSIGDFYGYKVIGRIMDANDIFDSDGNIKVALPTNVIDRETGVWVGDWLFEDMDGNGVIDEKDRTNLGSPLPKFTGGFGNTFSWKNWDFNVYLTYSYGNKVLNWLRVTMDNPNTTTNKFSRAGDYARLGLINEKKGEDDIWNVYVQKANKWIPRMSSGDVNNNSRISSLFVEDASYVRLQNVSIAYRLPHRICEKMHVSSLRISANLQNLFTFTKYSGYDPEIGMAQDQYGTGGQSALMNGIDTGRYPSPRICTFGLSIGF